MGDESTSEFCFICVISRNARRPYKKNRVKSFFVVVSYKFFRKISFVYLLEISTLVLLIFFKLNLKVHRNFVLHIR